MPGVWEGEVEVGGELSVLMCRGNFASDHRGTGTVVVSKRICISGRGTSGYKASCSRGIGVRMENGARGCIDHNKLGLRGTVSGFSFSLGSGVAVSVNTSANNFASYVLRGNTGGICSVSINCNRLT